MNPSKQITNHRLLFRSGIVLVVVLWVLVVLAVLTVALAQSARLDNAVRLAGADRVTARWLARAGVQRAVAEITKDISSTDCPTDSWYDKEKYFHEVHLPGGTFTICADRFYADSRCAYGMTDEASKINLNTATSEMLMALPEITETLANEILAWRKNQLNSSNNGEKDLSATEQPIRPVTKKGEIQTVRELGWVSKSVTEKLLYGEDRNLNGILENNEDDGEGVPPPDNNDGILKRGLLAYVTVYSYERNVDGLGQTRLNINTAAQEEMEGLLELHPAHARWIVEHRPFMESIAELLAEDQSVTMPETTPTRGGMAVLNSEEEVSIRPDLETFRRIADRITITNEHIIPGRININTAGAVVLGALPGMNESLVSGIVQKRQDLVEGFSSVAEVLTVPGMTVTQFKNLAALITVRSNVFTIRSYGRAEGTGIEHQIEVVIDRGQNRPQILYWKECL